MSDSDSEDELPPGWEPKVSANECIYYVNHITKSTQWIHPVSGKRKYINTAFPGAWQKKVEPNGDISFYNPETDQKTFIDPRLSFAVDLVESRSAPALTKYKDLNSSSTTEDVLGNLDLAGKTAIVTGANSGIGFETAKALASRGAHVILACRNADRANQAMQDIFSATPTAKLTFIHCDLTSLESVYTFCDTFLKMQVSLHMLILNAAVNALPYTLTGDNLELTFQVNHLSHFYMTSLLESRLRESSPSRVVVVASESHRFSSLTEENLTHEWTSSNFIAFMAYNDSKLLNLLFANELHRRLYKDNITVLSCHPGNLVFTNLQRNWWPLRLLYLLARPFTKSSNQGASTVVLCAVAPEIEGHGGRYFNNCRECTPSASATNETLGKLLWEHSKKLVNDVMGENKGIQ